MMTESSPLTHEKLAELRRTAAAIKFGEWYQVHGCLALVCQIGTGIIIAKTDGKDRDEAKAIARHIASCSPSTALAMLAHIDRFETDNAQLQQRTLELEKLVYVPGLWKCAKCNFQLIKSYLNALDGSVTANNTPGDKCPNCDVPMWRVTERDAGNETVDRCEQAVIAQREIEIKCAKLEAENARLREALSDLADTAEGLNETHSPTVCDEIRVARVLTEMSHGEGEDADRQ